MIRGIQRMFIWSAPYKKSLYFGFFISFINSLFIAIPIMMTGYVMKLLLEQMNGTLTITSKHYTIIILALVLSVIGRFICSYFRAKFQDMIGYEITADKRLMIGNTMKRVPLSFFRKNDTGTLTSAISTDLAFIEMHGIKMLDTIVNGYITLLTFFVVLAFYSWEIVVIAIVGTLISLYFLNKIGDKARQNSAAFQQARNVMTSAVLEFIRGIAIVKSFKLEGLANKSLKESFEKAKTINIKIENDFVVPNQSHLAVLKLTTVAIVIATSYFCYIDRLDVPTTIMFIVFSFTMFRGVEVINDAMHILKVIDDTFDKIEGIEQAVSIDETGEDIPLKNYDITFRDVTFSYEEQPVLSNISFTIPSNKTTAIVGPSGSGKSTICHLIARFYDVQSGEITIDDVPITALTTDALLKNISIVFQKVYLFNDTIMNNIRFGKSDATDEEVFAAAKRAHIHDFITSLPDGYETIVGEAGATLSGGEKQRISIARSIVKDAPIVILDEATASIDPENEHAIQMAIQELVAEKTLIVIAHRLKTIEHADQILVLNEGQLVQQGTHSDLMQVESVYKTLIECRKQTESWTILGGNGNE